MSGLRIGGDIGGTFTDLVLTGADGRCLAVAKTLTTAKRPSEGLLRGIDQLLETSGRRGDEVDEVLHGTTLITNALIERRGARTALVTTAGFRDVLHIGRELRYDLYDLDLVLPQPLVPRRWCLEIDERVLADGHVRRQPSLHDIDGLLDVIEQERIQSAAVCLLHSYRSPEHEQLVADELRRRRPDLHVTTSAEVLPQIGEYARASTTVANAYVRPLLRSYLDELTEGLTERTPNAALSLISSTGRVAPANVAAEVPIRLVESGPAGGVLAGRATARAADAAHALTFDMGGTTAKACYVVDGIPRLTDSFEVARVRRFVRGSGLPIQVPTIELIEIGAGGGSIAVMNDLGLLQVGPRSAGSDPGPACYGLGGTQPTVTDADLVLGHLAADSFLGGDMRLDVEAARTALASLTLDGNDPSDPVAAAVALRRVVDEQMAAAARMHAVEQGLTPATFTLVATGGAGPVHACSVARILGIRRVLSPARAGVASAHGFLGAPAGFDVVRSAPEPLDALTPDTVQMLLAELEAEALSRLPADPRTRTGHRIVEADMRYRGQGAAVTVTLPSGFEDDPVGTLLDALENEYQRRYQRVPTGVTAELLTWRLSYLADEPPNLPLQADRATTSPVTRPAWFDVVGDFVDTPVRDRGTAEGPGPMIIEERESTLVVSPEAHVRRLAHDVLEVTW